MRLCIDCNKNISKSHSNTLRCFDCARAREKIVAKESYIRSKQGFPKECLFCKNKAENIHHADMDRTNNEKKNLIPLCMSCHKKIHAFILKPIIKKYKRSRR
jgi:hypothetical protein